MSNAWVDIVSTTGRFYYSGLVDLLALPTRPLVLLYQMNTYKFSSLQMFVDGGIVVGGIGTVSVIATAVSCGVLCGGFARGPATLAGLGYLVEAMAQLPKLLFPYGCEAIAETNYLVYPTSKTGLVTMLLQLPCGASLFFNSAMYPPMPYYGFFSVSVAMRFMSRFLATPGGVASRLLYGASLPVFALSFVTPAAFETMCKALEPVARLCWDAFQVVFKTVQYVLPKVRDAILAIAQHPLIVGIYRRVVVPIWNIITPWVWPVVTAGLAASCGFSVRRAFLAGIMEAPVDVQVTVAGQTFAGCAAALSCTVLTYHACLSLNPQQVPDPLEKRRVLQGLRAMATAIALPWRITQACFSVLLEHFLGPLFRDVLSKIFSLAASEPLLCIPAVLAFNGMLLYFYSHLDVAKHLGQAGDFMATVVAYIMSAARAAQTMSVADVSDSSFAVLCMGIGQVGAYATVRLILERVHYATAAPIVPSGAGRRQGSTTAPLLSLDDLEEVADALQEPRLCGRCFFGPVDVRGCNNLRSHHGEQLPGGGQISNACPRCGWFSPTLNDWLHWDPSLHTSRGRVVLRQRAWADITLVVRAASKALVVPFAMLRLGGRLSLPPVLSAFLAFSYLVPWALQNGALALAVFTESDFQDTLESLTSSRQRHQNRYAARRARRQDRAEADGHGPEEEDPADCGAAGQNELLLPNVTHAEALVNMTTAVPDRIFMHEGEGCSICLSAWPEGALKVVSASMPREEAAAALKQLVPPVVALRCGHTLHLDCAVAALEAAMRSGAASRHVRCPLCREPVTLAGAAAARLFS